MKILNFYRRMRFKKIIISPWNVVFRLQKIFDTKRNYSQRCNESDEFNCFAIVNGCISLGDNWIQVIYCIAKWLIFLKYHQALLLTNESGSVLFSSKNQWTNSLNAQSHSTFFHQIVFIYSYSYLSPQCHHSVVCFF